jgi:D-alanyl-D-alanine carboxypeptidase
MAQEHAPAQGPEGSLLLVDADTGTVLESENPTHPWYPASLTKVMTAYMVFWAIEDGRISLADRITVSPHAAAQPQTRMGLRAGQTVTVQALLDALLLRSANDAAVALAERFSGSEEHFAISMTRRARTLGMSQTFFRNASGLPHAGQVTTARDLAILAKALVEDYPHHLNRFGRPGTILTKTGFTCGSGYNLLRIASRNGRRLIGVVLGAKSGGQRNARMLRLLENGFALPASQPSGALLLTALSGQARQTVPYVLDNGSCPVAASPRTETMAEGVLPGWGLVFGSFTDRDRARATILGNSEALKDIISETRPAIVANRQNLPPSYSALLVGLQEGEAVEACDHLRASGVYCLAIPPKLLNNPRALWR